jgi:hypothetical protein
MTILLNFSSGVAERVLGQSWMVELGFGDVGHLFGSLVLVIPAQAGIQFCV